MISKPVQRTHRDVRSTVLNLRQIRTVDPHSSRNRRLSLPALLTRSTDTSTQAGKTRLDLHHNVDYIPHRT